MCILFFFSSLHCLCVHCFLFSHFSVFCLCCCLLFTVRCSLGIFALAAGRQLVCIRELDVLCTSSPPVVRLRGKHWINSTAHPSVSTVHHPRSKRNSIHFGATGFCQFHPDRACHARRVFIFSSPRSQSGQDRGMALFFVLLKLWFLP